MTFSVWARQDSVVANNPNLNPIGITGVNGRPAIQLTFVPANSSGDAILEYNGGLTDPDTLVQIGSNTYPFRVLLAGDLPAQSNVPADFVGRTIYLIEVTINNRVVEYFFVTGEPPVTEAMMNQIRTGAIALDNLDLTPAPYCLAAGTGIATPSGQRRVEKLRPGDHVMTADGRSVPIRWIGSSRYSRWQASRDAAVRPIHVRAGAFGRGLPRRDLVLSPQHRVVVSRAECEFLFDSPRVFVAAKHLPWPMAHSPLPSGEVVYYHLLFDQHEIMLANGLPVESFQPARRMIETLTPQTREVLETALQALGRDHMLTRPDALPTLAAYEARVLSSLAFGPSRTALAA